MDFIFSKMCSSSNWALVAGFTREFCKTDSCVLISVHFVNQLVEFFLSDEVSSGLNHPSNFICRNLAIFIQIKGIESFISVETWSRIESLSEGFSSILTSDMCSPHCLVFISGRWVETIISSGTSWVWIVSWSSIYHGRIISIMG